MSKRMSSITFNYQKGQFLKKDFHISKKTITFTIFEILYLASIQVNQGYVKQGQIE